MTKSLIPLLFVFAACSSGEGDDQSGTFGASFTTDSSNASQDMDEDDDLGTEEDTDTESSTGTTGTTGTTETTETTEESEETEPPDPCIAICGGMSNSLPNTCDAPYIVGRSDAKDGFFFGGNTTSATDDDNEACGPNSDPSNLDTSHDHFFRIWLYTGDMITVTQNASGWDPRVKIHDEAECIGKAKLCSDNDENTIEYVAPKDDWFTIVADGQVIAFDDFGDYTLTIDLVQGEEVIDMCACP